MTTTNPPKNEVIPVEIANVIIERHDSTLILVEKSSQVIFQVGSSVDKFSLDLW